MSLRASIQTGLMNQSSAQVIDGSLRFDDDKQHYLNKVLSSNGNKRIFTYSAWVKSTNQRFYFLNAQASSPVKDYYFVLSFIADGRIILHQRLTEANKQFEVITSSYYRDPSAWYHIVAAFDTTNSTASDRIKLYVNGERVTSFGTANYPALNLECSFINTSGSNLYINRQLDNAWNYGNSYLSNVYLIDGQALGPEYFGFTDPLTNTWRPKKFSGEFTTGTVVYSTGISGSLDTTNGGPASVAFNGSIEQTNLNGVYPNPGNSVTWTPANSELGTTLSYSSTARVYVKVDVNGDAGGLTVVGANGSQTISTGVSGNSYGWVDITAATSPITSIAWSRASSGSQGVRLLAVEIDGTILTDFQGTNSFYLPMDGNSPIGQDKSGNGNDWTPVNFGGSNSVDRATGALPILNTDGGGKVARVGVRTDADASNLVLALPLVGSKDDVSNRINSGSTTKTITANGNAAASSTQSNFYGGSWYFDGSGDYLSIPSSSDFDFGTGDFTIEGWVYNTSLPSGDKVLVELRGSGGGGDGWVWFLNSSNQMQIYDQSLRTAASTAVTVNNWHHLAISRSSGTLYYYVNGQAAGSFSYSSSTNASSTGIRIATRNDTTNSLFGYIQDLRIYKGVAKYTSNFIPASTNPDILPDTPSGVSGSSKLAKITDGAVSFDGSGDNLSFSLSSGGLGSGDFTLEYFVYQNTLSNYQTHFGVSRGVNGFNVGTDASGDFVLYSASARQIEVVGAITTGRWYHWAFVRSGSTLTGYLDGRAIDSYSSSENFSGTTCTIGSLESNGEYTNGFISNFRILKGTALYTSDFTPPTAPLTNVTNTTLLCCQSNTSATAAAVAPGSITANGNASATNFNPFNTDINTVRGQETGYATLNPLDKKSSTVLSAGNLTYSASSSAVSNARSTLSFPSSGKYYFESTNITQSSGYPAVGIARNDVNVSGGYNVTGSMVVRNIASQSRRAGFEYDGNNHINMTPSATPLEPGDTLQFLVDCDARKVYVGINGTLYGRSNATTMTVVSPSDITSGTNPAYELLSGYSYFAWVSAYTSSSSGAVNFGQKPFKFSPPEGFQPLNAANVRPSTVIARPDQYVGVVTYTSDGNAQNLDLGFKPDFVWFSRRNVTGGIKYLVDSVRGIDKVLSTSHIQGTEAENALTGGGSYDQVITSLNPTGITIGTSTQSNANTGTYVAWAWKAGGNSNTFNIDDVGYASASAAGLTAGTITPTGASVGTKHGFSIVSYTGTGGTSDFGHGLNTKPGFVIIRNRSTAGYYWICSHSSLASNQNVYLNATLAAQTYTSQNHGGIDLVNSTSSVVKLLTGVQSADNVNRSGDDYIAYCWHDVPGLQKFGSYEGNNSADGPFIELGFRPAIIIFKNIDSGSPNWEIYDFTERDKINPYGKVLSPNTNLAENDVSASYPADALSNGIKIRHNGAAVNAANTYIYAAWAEAPQFNLFGGQSNAR